MSQATSTQSGEKAPAHGPLDGYAIDLQAQLTHRGPASTITKNTFGYAITNPHGYDIAGWSCSKPLKDFEIKHRMPGDENRRTEADDANYLCRTINPSLADNCQRCFAWFNVGVEALDKDGKVVATLNMITERGDFYWQYSKDHPGYKRNLTWNQHSTDWDRFEKKQQGK